MHILKTLHFPHITYYEHVQVFFVVYIIAVVVII